MAIKTAFHASRESFPKIKVSFETINFFSISLELWVEISSEFSDFLSAVLAKLQISCPENTPRKSNRSNSAEVGTLLTFFWSLNRRKSWLQQKTKQQECRNCIAVSIGTFGRKQFFWSFYKFSARIFGHWEKKLDFSRKTAAELSKLLFFVSRKHLKKTSLPKNVLFFPFLSAFEHKKRVNFASNFWHVRRNWTPLVRRKSLPKFEVFEKKILSINVDLRNEVFGFWL